MSMESMTIPLLAGHGNIICFTTTRYGSNREILCREMNIPEERLFVPCQTHGSEALIVDEPFLALSPAGQADTLQGIDALITALPKVCIAVATADCVPILLYAPDKGVIAAVHAGWRGTVLQIAWKTVRRMVSQFGCAPSLMFAGMGPCIGREAFETGEEVVEAFRLAGADMQQILDYCPKTNKPHIDLREANRLQLIETGLLPEHIETSGVCTYSSGDFFSARRQGIQCGRMLSGIIIPNRVSNPVRDSRRY
ncbi:Laccase domain protein [Bacteroidales bacterium Barb6XT]|nr:Laccase domain protein [Bacteroidales bacterium Barb6XT]